MLQHYQDSDRYGYPTQKMRVATMLDFQRKLQNTECHFRLRLQSLLCDSRRPRGQVENSEQLGRRLGRPLIWVYEQEGF